MNIETLVFFIFSFISILLAIYLIQEQNPVRSALALMAIFLATSINWFILNAEFLAVTLVLVYLGAVMVLFLFVIMMLPQHENKKKKIRKYSETAITICMLLFSLYKLQPYFSINNNLSRGSSFSIHEFAIQLYTHYLVHLQIAGLILMVAMIAGVSISFRGPQSRKIQKNEEQVSVKKENRLTIIKDMKP